MCRLRRRHLTTSFKSLVGFLFSYMFCTSEDLIRMQPTERSVISEFDLLHEVVVMNEAISPCCIAAYKRVQYRQYNLSNTSI